MKHFKPVVLAILYVGLALLASCSEERSEAKIVQKAQASTLSEVDAPLKLKDLALGIKFNSLKIKPSATLSTGALMFNYEYFGQSRSVLASTNSAGVVYKYEITMGDSSALLKSSIAEKYSKESKKPVAFNCSVNKISPDSSADMTTELCELTRGTELLQIKETIMQPAARSNGLPQLPTKITSIKLVDTKLAQESSEAAKKDAAERTKKADDKKRGDV